MMIPDENGVIESAVEPVKNRKLYWLNTINDKMYILKNGEYEELANAEELKQRITALEGKIQKEIECKIYRATESTSVIQIYELELGGIYEIVLSYNHVTTGNVSYRSTLYAILSINCGYNSTTKKVVVRPKLNIISNYSGLNTVADDKVRVVVADETTERNVEAFLAEKFVYIYFSNSTNQGEYKIKIRKLN